MTAPITGQSHQAVEATPEWLAEEVAETYGNLAAGASQPGTLWERATAHQPFGYTRPAGSFARIMRARRIATGVLIEKRSRESERRAHGLTIDGPFSAYRDLRRSGVIRAGVRVK